MNSRTTLSIGLVALVATGAIGAASVLGSPDRTRADMLPGSGQPTAAPTPTSTSAPSGSAGPSAVGAAAPMTITVEIRNMTDVDFRLVEADHNGHDVHWQERPSDVFAGHSEQEWTMYAVDAPEMMVTYANPGAADSFHIYAAVPDVGANRLEAEVYYTDAYVVTCNGDTGWHPTYYFQIVHNDPGIIPCKSWASS